jgi:DNA-binding PucR family transcriptional regulator
MGGCPKLIAMARVLPCSRNVSGMVWQRPSERVCELMRAGARQMLNAAGEPSGQFLDALDSATLADQDPALADDPALVAALRRSNRANLLFWVQSILRDPAAQVPPNPGPEPLTIARDLVRRGLDEGVLHAWRAGQNSGWRQWMRIAFSLTSDSEELQELLDYSARSIFTFVDATIAAVSAQVRLERDQLTRGTHTQRLETVALIIDGAPITRRHAATRLGYDLDQPHLAAIIWSEHPKPDATALQRAAEALAGAAGAAKPLTVTASAGALWVWVTTTTPPHISDLTAILDQLPEIRFALGPIANGIEGFRRSHLNALATQRLLMRATKHLQVARWEDVQLTALLTHDEPRAHEFVQHTLGELAHAEPELRETTRVYLREQSNAPRAAKHLYTHRNTVLTRLARAEKLLPRPLAENSLEVAAALEVAHWTT